MSSAFRRYIGQHREELVDLLERWDEDGDGCINPKEFRAAWSVLQMDADLGYKVPRSEVEELYNELDHNSTGNVPIDELSSALREMRLAEGCDDIEEEEEEEEEHGEFEDDEDEQGDDGDGGSGDEYAVQRSDSAPPPLRRPRSLKPLSISGDDRSRSDSLPMIRRGPPPQYTPRKGQQRWVGEEELSSTSSRDGSPIRTPRSRSSSPPFGTKGVQPPRHSNLPALGSPRPGRAPSVAGSVAASHMTGVSGCSCSSSRAGGLTVEQQVARRAQRERELNARLSRWAAPRAQAPPPPSDDSLAPGLDHPPPLPHRHLLPGFNVPGPGGSDPKGLRSTTTLRVKPGPGLWTQMTGVQHLTYDSKGRVIQTKKTHIGDPGIYHSKLHEMTHKRVGDVDGCSAVFSSAVPQRLPVDDKILFVR